MNSARRICRIGLPTAYLVLAFGLFPMRVMATLHLFLIDSSATSLALQGSTGTGVWQEQGPGSLTATFQGWLVVDLQASSMQIVFGSGMVADQTNSWQPGPLGSVTPTPASYGAKTVIGSEITANNVTVALRNLTFEVLSPQLTTDNGPIEASSVSLTIPDHNSTLDYQANGLVVLRGSRALGGLNATNAGGTMTLSIAAEVQTLTIPIDVSFTSQVLATNDTTLHFTGTLVAWRGLTIINRQLLWFPSPTDHSQFILIWDGSFILQRASTLALPDWTDFATNPPTVISASGPFGFLRVGGL
jgi:hypothetical protein